MFRLCYLFFPLVAISCLVCGCNSHSEFTAEPDVGETIKAEKVSLVVDDDEPCTAPASWFKEVNGVRHTDDPAEGVDSPFYNQAKVNNCDFHKWSWQKFLWLTNEVNKRPQFLDLLKQVSPDGGIVGANDAYIYLEEDHQASGKSDKLKTPGSSPTTVYYAIFMDDSMYDTMTKYAPIEHADPTAVTLTTYPVGALEVKTSWIEASALKDPSKYFVTQAVFNDDKDNPKSVALLGMHVVGVVQNHPEFVWATFEHEDLVPSYDWNKATNTKDAPVASSVALPFFAKGANATVKNITSNNGINTDVFAVYQYGTPVEKDQSNQKVYMNTSQNGAQNFTKINQLNQSVKKQLGGVWNNYFYNGSIWVDTEEAGTDPKAQAKLLNSIADLGDASPGNLIRGSVAAYNITMETYVQVGFSSDGIHDTQVSDLVSCFLCHSTSKGGVHSPLHFSHVYNGYLGSLKGLTKEQVKDSHVKEVRARFSKRKR